MRIWGKIWLENRLIKDTVYETENNDTRTHLIFKGIEEFCREFDLAKPIWLEKNIAEFKRDKKTRFRQDNFMEEIDFDYLEVEILEE
ncbi:MAG: hypothetical protein II147_06375 [Lachnospiraceae bacterium]|jgi:hypothetical protein|nr:hypothetical protein [Lachnospiraceae bacterium]